MKTFFRPRRAEGIHHQQTCTIIYTEGSPSGERKMTEARNLNQEMKSTGNGNCMGKCKRLFS